MKFSTIINYPLSLLGLKLAKVSSIKKLQEVKQYMETNGSDIENDLDFMRTYEKVRQKTMVGIERCYSLYYSLRYIIRNNIEGDLVECGVWRGGSAMLIAYTLLEAGQTGKKIWLYDTFQGMPEPGKMDGEHEKKEWERQKLSNGGSGWCNASLEEVRDNLISTGYPEQLIEFVVGKVEETIPDKIPSKIALARLDTDWYESTRHELTHLYPKLEEGGVLIIDDYGSWQGARKATNEYFASQNSVYLHRIDFTGRLLIKR